MCSERRQEIAKAKLKKARLQLNTPGTVNQNQGGGNQQPKPTNPPVPASPPVGTPPQANVPRKAQVGPPVRAARAKVPPAAPVAGPKKVAPSKQLVAKTKAKNVPAAPGVATAEVEDDQASPTDIEYDTDGLELPMDSGSKSIESGGGKKIHHKRNNDN